MVETLQTAALVFLILTAPISLYICWTDLRFMRMPNWTHRTILAIFVVAGLILLPFDMWLWRWFNFAVVLLVGFLIWSMRLGFGAGDMKYAAAVAPYIHPADSEFVLLLLAAFLISVLIVHRLFRAIPFVRRATPEWESWTNKKVPVGIAISGTFSFYLFFVSYPPALTGLASFFSNIY